MRLEITDRVMEKINHPSIYSTLLMSPLKAITDVRRKEKHSPTPCLPGPWTSKEAPCSCPCHSAADSHSP